MLAKTLGLSALAGLASEGASQVVKKISGSGQRAKRAMTGGFLIPQDKIQKLIDNKHLLTNKQKEQILSALQSGGQIVVKPSKKQSGGLLGTMLASIGIPLAIEAVKSVFGKGAPRIGRPKRKRSAENWPTKRRERSAEIGRSGGYAFSTPSSNRGELGAGDLLGTWDGEKKIQKRRTSEARRGTSAGIEKPIQQHPNSRGNIVSAKLSEVAQRPGTRSVQAKPRPKFTNKPLSKL